MQPVLKYIFVGVVAVPGKVDHAFILFSKAVIFFTSQSRITMEQKVPAVLLSLGFKTCVVYSCAIALECSAICMFTLEKIKKKKQVALAGPAALGAKLFC